MTEQHGTALLAEIEQLEGKRQKAMVAKDFETLSSILDNDLIYVHSTGRLMSKTEYLDHLRSNQFAYESITPRVGGRHIETDGSFILIRHLSAAMKIEDKHIDVQLTVLTVWRSFGTTWTLVSSVSTKMSD